MADGLLGILPPGQRAWLAAEQFQRQKSAQDLQNFGGLLNIQSQLEMKPLQAQMLQIQLRNAQLNNQIREGLLGGNNGGSMNAAQGGNASATPGLNPQVMGMLASGDPGLMAIGKALLETSKGIAQRPGAPVVNPYTGQVIAQPTPSVPAGVALQVGPGGPQAFPVPGAQGAMNALTASQAGAQEAGKAPFQLETLNTQGAPTLMTREQAIQAATGRPMQRPGMSIAPAEQMQRDIQAKNITSGLTPSGTGPAIPTANVVQGSTAGIPGLRLQDQGQSAEQRQYGERLANQAGTVMEDAAKAAIGNRYLDVMEGYAKDFNPGKLAPMQSSLTQWAQAFGLPVSEEDKKAAGSIQGLTSIAIKMAGQATRQSDAQPSQLQYFKILESMPNEQRTPEGFAKIVGYMRDLNNLNIIKAQELQKWRQQHGGTAEGFEAQWPDMAKQIPMAWNQQKASTGSNNSEAQSIVDELRRRGVIK